MCFNDHYSVKAAAHFSRNKGPDRPVSTVNKATVRV